MKQAQETSDFYPTRRAGEAPPEGVIGGGVFKPDLSDTPDLPEKGVTLKHVRETVRGILSALKGTATLVAVAVSAMLMAESITGTEGELLENLPGDSTVLLDAPAVKQLLDGKADKRHTHADLQQAIDETTIFTSSDGATTMTLPWKAAPNSYSEDGAVGVAAIYGSGLDGFAVTDGKGNAVDFVVSGSNYGIISVMVDAYGYGKWSRYVLPKAIDSSLNATSTNPVQNKVIKAALDTLQRSDHTEVWKGNVGFGEQDTFFGPKKVADGEGQFLNGYPRLHNHGQDIHEVSGFSRDSRDDEDVWSHRLLLPWDLAKANDTSYLMAGVVWNGQRNLFTNGDTATFVQPLLPQNSGSTQSALPYAIPCFESSPVYWKGTIIWNDGTQAISKAVQIPWARVKQDMRGPTELALKSDIPSIDSALSTTSTNPIQNKAVKAELDKKLALTGGTVTGETRFEGGIRTDSFKTLYGTPLLETVSSKGFKFTGLYQLVPYRQTKPFFTAESGTTTLDVTTAKATSFIENGTTLADKYATKVELALKQNQLTAGANVTLAEDGTISATCPGADTGWVSPGDWTLSVTPAEVSTLVSAETVVLTNEVQQVIGTATTSTTSSAPKMVALEMLDVSQPPPEVTFVCDGATLTRSENAQSALVSAETEGLYRLSATDDSGRVRSAYLSLRAPEVSTKLEEIYLADVPGTARAAVNDALLAALQTRDTSTTVQSGITAAVATGDQCFDASGAPLASAPLAPKFFCCVEPSRSWGPDAVAVAPHFAVTAAHWKPPQAKTATFRTPEGVSATVSGSWGISLVEWAQQRGYAAAEIRDANLGDIWVWQFDTGTIPDACIPYVFDRSGWEHYYHGDLSGIACYAITQNGYLSFGQLHRPDAGAYSIGLFSARYTRADLLAALSPPACARIYGGDSGRPVMMIHEGEPVLLSTFRTAGSGPSMIKACDILDDLIKTRSGGTESLKRISAP